MREELTAILTADLPDQEDAAKLEAVLYQRCYTRSIADEADDRTASGTEDLTPLLDKANQGVTAWDEGWCIDQLLEEGSVLARKGAAVRAFRPGEYLVRTGIGCAAKPGAPMSILLPAGAPDVQPGMWFAFGTTVTEFDPTRNGLRLYWNISAEGAPHLVEAVTREFNRFQVPFNLKCPDRADGYARRDAAVLYVARRYYPLTALLIERIHHEVRDWLRPGTPLFTKRLADGLALAEDPGESFGKHRCRILAAAMVQSRGQAVEGRVAVVREHFKRHRLVPDRPWLNPDSAAEYPFPFAAE